MNHASLAVSPTKKTAQVIGAIYIAGFFFGILGALLSARPETAPSAHQALMIGIGACLWVLAALGDFAHGVLMFPILKQHSERFALAYFGTRTLQSGLIILFALLLLLQIPITKQLAVGAVQSSLPIHFISALCFDAQNYVYHMGMAVLGIAGALLCFCALQASLLPRKLAMWGLVGYLIFFGGSILEILRVELHLIHTIVGGVWEVTMGIWLICIGFNASVVKPKDVA